MKRTASTKSRSATMQAGKATTIRVTLSMTAAPPEMFFNAVMPGRFCGFHGLHKAERQPATQTPTSK